MADRSGVTSAMFFDLFKDGATNFFGDEGVAGKHRSILDVIERMVFGEAEFQNYRATDDFVPVSQGDAKIFKSTEASKIHPPRRLHESGIRGGLQKIIPSFPAGESRERRSNRRGNYFFAGVSKRRGTGTGREWPVHVFQAAGRGRGRGDAGVASSL